jgi:hypothetical protein
LCESIYDGGEKEVTAMQPLKEDSRDKRRTVADALEVIREELGVDEMPGAEIRVSLLPLPSGEATAAVALVCPDLDCCVSFPASRCFTAFPENCSQRHRFEISCLQEAKVGPTGSVVLTDGRCLRGVEMVPTHMPYELSLVEERILWNVIKFTASYGCFRNLRDDLPQHLQAGIPDLWVLDYGRLHTIPRRPLKTIKAYIETHDPELRVSNQKIADALAKCGVRVPRRRPQRVR